MNEETTNLDLFAQQQARSFPPAPTQPEIRWQLRWSRSTNPMPQKAKNDDFKCEFERSKARVDTVLDDEVFFDTDRFIHNADVPSHNTMEACISLETRWRQ